MEELKAGTTAGPELSALRDRPTDQAYTFGGVDREGRDATNDLTYMLLDTCELHPARRSAARIHKGSPRIYGKDRPDLSQGSPTPALQR